MTVFAPGHVGSDASNLLLLLSSSSSFLLLLLWDSASSARNLSLSLSLASFISSLIRGTSGANRSGSYVRGGLRVYLFSDDQFICTKFIRVMM